ncbi:hypothetical protein OG607_03695 [Streptomyces sp. NBC_01537]|uniref:hypothetical protein n=1 Tax=Streptomyces sp. NBC_01537 TaxID=2903896 RepID=UPI003867E25B
MSPHSGVVVLGAGPSGYVAAVRAAQLGKTIQPWSRAAYKAPRPRRYSAAIDNATRALTGPSAHRTASVSWKGASARA